MTTTGNDRNCHVKQRCINTTFNSLLFLTILLYQLHSKFVKKFFIFLVLSCLYDQTLMVRSLALGMEQFWIFRSVVPLWRGVYNLERELITVCDDDTLDCTKKNPFYWLSIIIDSTLAALKNPCYLTNCQAYARIITQHYIKYQKVSIHSRKLLI